MVPVPRSVACYPQQGRKGTARGIKPSELTLPLARVWKQHGLSGAPSPLSLLTETSATSLPLIPMVQLLLRILIQPFPRAKPKLFLVPGLMGRGTGPRTNRL